MERSIMTETVGDRIKKLRKMHNFTQKQVADYLGFKQTQIAKLESNDRKLKSSSLNSFNHRLIHSILSGF